MTTPSQTVGPYFTIGLRPRGDNVLSETGTLLAGVLLDGQGAPISDGMIELWDGKHWGRCGTDGDGRFEFTVDKPAGAAPYFDVYVFARGLLRHQWTRVYFPGEDNETDPVFAALSPDDRETLVATEAGDVLNWDIRMQGDAATAFFAH